MAAVQSEYSDRLFNFIFGSEENRAWTLSLYNAINGTSYERPEDIELNTIREVLYLGMHNDVSFLIYSELNLYEQQSSYNPNMPLREMQYVGNLYEKYIKQNRLNKYSEKLIQLPVPKLVVFYNGTDKQPDETILRLSDSFPEEKKTESDIEVRVRMININYGHNKKLLQACKPLQEYTWIIEEIRRRKAQGESLEKAIEHTISAVPADYLLKTFLEAHRAEVRGMLLTEYNEAETMELFKEEAHREGLKEGRIQEFISLRREDGKTDADILLEMMQRYQLSEQEAEKFLGDRV